MNLRDILTTSAAAIALTAAGSAHAEGTYLSLFGGLSTFDDEINLQGSNYNPGSFVPRHPAGGSLSVRYDKTFSTSFTTPTASGITTISEYRVIGFTLVKGASSTAIGKYGSSFFAWEDEFDSGFVVGAAIGTSLGENFRGELEFAYRSADVEGGGSAARGFTGTIYKTIYVGSPVFYYYRYLNTASGTPGGFYTTGGYGFPVAHDTATTTAGPLATGPVPPVQLGPLYIPFSQNGTAAFSSGGDVDVWSIMANVWYDFNFFGLNPDGVTTFVGGGIGVANVKLDYSASAATILGVGTISTSLDESANALAYQLGAGIGFDLGNGMMLSAQYRWFGTSDVDLGPTDLRVESHNALISLSVPLGNILP